jgi:transposase
LILGHSVIDSGGCVRAVDGVVGLLAGLDVNAMFGAALGLAEPWEVASVEFDEGAGRLDIALDFPRGVRFGCPEPGCAQSGCAVHDTADKTWRHLDFFEHQAYLSARVPRVRCPEHGVHLVDVPWARPGSGFTLLFEVAMLTYAKQMPIAALARMAREHDTRVWRVISHHVNTARAGMDFSDVVDLGMDETSARRGQDYVSIFMDLTQKRVLFATEGRDANTVRAFAADLKAHGGEPTVQIQRVCCDMSPAFIKGIGEHLSRQPRQADGLEPAVEGHRPQIVFDRYHVVAKANEAVDRVRRVEAKTRPELKRSRYAWLKNDANLTNKQRDQLTWLTRPSMQLKTARAARWRDDFNGFYDQPTPQQAETYLRRWCYGAKRSRLEPIKEFVRLVEAHWDGIVSWQRSRISNGLLEGTNSLIQAAKRRARGYRNKTTMITIIYLTAGKLPLPQIHTI